MKETNIQIIGAGVVGAATGYGLEYMGHDVLYVDVSGAVRERLARKGCKVAAAPSEDYDVIMVSVPTPSVRGKLDFEYLKSAMFSIGQILDEDKVVVIRSTVPPGTTVNLLNPILERSSGLTVGQDFGLCMNPEFLTAEAAQDDFIQSESFIVGEIDVKSGDALERVYAPWDVPVIRGPIEFAELVKFSSNVFGALKISYFNILGKVAEQCNVDSNLLVETIADYSHILQNPRYGIYPGLPYGGMCFPKDTLSFIEYLNLNGTAQWSDMLEAMHKMNMKIATELGQEIPEYEGL